MNLHKAEFIRSAAKISDFPTDGLPQIIFAGKSNVGKSSTINKLLGRKNFARVGGTPGKTVHINFFEIDKRAYFVDLPGYGYAKVSKKERDRWGALIEDYFAEGQHKALGIHIVDMRHKPTADDVIMSNYYMSIGMPVIVIANKYDKVKASERQKNIDLIRETLNLPERVLLVPFSAEKGQGKEEVLEKIFEIVEQYHATMEIRQNAISDENDENPDDNDM